MIYNEVVLFYTNPVGLPVPVIVRPPAEFHFTIPAIAVIASIKIHCRVAYLGQFLCEIR